MIQEFRSEPFNRTFIYNTTDRRKTPFRVKPLDEIPQHLYKVQVLNERSVEMFIKNMMYFAHPNQFNDPEEYLGWVRYVETDWNIDEQKTILKNLQWDYPRPDGPRLLNNQAITDIFAVKHGILSLMSHVAGQFGPLAWAHYGDNSRGFAIRLNSVLINSFDDNVTLSKPIRLNYAQTLWMSSVQVDNVAAQEFCRLSTKLDAWIYEDEFRVFSTTVNNFGHFNMDGSGSALQTPRTIKMKEGAIDGLVLGSHFLKTYGRNPGINERRLNTITLSPLASLLISKAIDMDIEIYEVQIRITESGLFPNRLYMSKVGDFEFEYMRE